MFTNSQKRSGGGQSLNAVSLQVTQAVTAGQDLYINEAGDIAPSEWFTGTTVLFDNVALGAAYTWANKVEAGDVASFDSTTVYAAILVTNGSVPLGVAIRRCNPITGEISASAYVTVAADSWEPNSNQRIQLMVVPLSATVVSVVMSGYDATNTRYITRANKFTVSGSTFTAAGWTTALLTSGVIADSDRVLYQAATAGAGRFGFMVRGITTTTSVVFIYNPTTHAFTTVSLSYGSAPEKDMVKWTALEGLDVIAALEGPNTALVVRHVASTAATGISSSLNINTHINDSNTRAVVSLSSTRLVVSGFSTPVTQKTPTRLVFLNFSADYLTLTLGNVYTLPTQYNNSASTAPYYATAAGGGKLYMVGRNLLHKYASIPPGGDANGLVNDAATNPTVLEIGVTLTTADVNSIRAFVGHPAMRIDPRRWEPFATRKLRAIYCPYYRAFIGRCGFASNVIEQSRIVADAPILNMPELTYALGTNGLAFVGSASSGGAAGATVPVVLGTNSVKLNNNLTPVKAMKNGVIALTNLWGARLPKGQRNEGFLDYKQVPNSNFISTELGVAGSQMMGYMAEGFLLDIRNSQGTVEILLEGTSSVNESSGNSYCGIVAIVDGRPSSMAVATRFINKNATSGGSLVYNFSFTDSLMFGYTPGIDWAGTDAVVRPTAARVTLTKLEDKYHE